MTAALGPDFRVLVFWPFPTCSPGGLPPLCLPGRQGRKLGSESLLESRAGGLTAEPHSQHSDVRERGCSQGPSHWVPLPQGRPEGEGEVPLAHAGGAGPQLQEGSQGPSGKTASPDPCPRALERSSPIPRLPQGWGRRWQQAESGIPRQACLPPTDLEGPAVPRSSWGNMTGKERAEREAQALDRVARGAGRQGCCLEGPRVIQPGHPEHRTPSPLGGRSHRLDLWVSL